jgi:CYTH domain-containing protein
MEVKALQNHLTLRNQNYRIRLIGISKDLWRIKMKQRQIIKERLEELPDDLKKEALDFIEFLLQKRMKRIKKKRFKFDWEGSLSELKDKYTSVELQHKAMEWR